MINVFIIAAMSADGFIAHNHHEFINWSSTEDKKLYRSRTLKAGVMIMGKNTYNTMGKPLPNRRTIVYSHTPIDHPDVETTQEAPADLIQRLASEGYTEVAICGGSAIYSLFLGSGVVNELAITVEPVIFGDGVKLFNTAIAKKLHLRSVENLTEDTLLLNYEVKK